MNASARPTGAAPSPVAAAFMVALAGLVPFLTALGGGFVSDAAILLERNRTLAQSSGWLVWFTRDFYWGTPMQDVTLYRPLTLLSLLAQVRTTGLDPFPFCAGNVLLHVTVCLAVLALGRSLCAPRAALAGALLFAVHPLHSEAVAWIMGRSELLAAAFAVAAVLAFLRAVDPRSSRGYLWSAASAVALFGSVLSKETAVLLPLWMVAVALVLRRNARRGPALAGVVLALAALAAFAVLRASALTRPAELPADLELFNPAAALSAPARWLAAAGVGARYAALFLWPGTLSHDYSRAEIAVGSFSLWEAAGLALIALALAATVAAARRAPGLALLGTLGAVTWLPVSNLPIAIGTIMAERLIYLPSVAAALAAGWCFDRFARGSRWNAAGLAILVALATRTAVRNLDWKSDRTIYEAALSASPRSAYAKAVVADQARVRGELDRAQALAREALAIYPAYYDARIVLAQVLVAREDWAGAATEIRAALALDTDDEIRSRLRSNLGAVLARAGKTDEALREYREALRLDPRNEGARRELRAHGE